MISRKILKILKQLNFVISGWETVARHIDDPSPPMTSVSSLVGHSSSNDLLEALAASASASPSNTANSSPKGTSARGKIMLTKDKFLSQVGDFFDPLYLVVLLSYFLSNRVMDQDTVLFPWHDLSIYGVHYLGLSHLPRKPGKKAQIALGIQRLQYFQGICTDG